MTDFKRRRLPPLVGTVKFLAIDESAPVVAFDRVARRGLRSGAGCQNLVLQAAGQRNHAVFTFVGGQKCFAFGLIRSRSLLRFLLLLFLNLGLNLVEHSFRFVLRQTRLRACCGVLHSLGNQIPVHVHRLFF